jgi:DNA-binding NarL/FixJ family response regulator
MKQKTKNPPTPKPKRILVVDDHPLMREGVARWIQGAPDLDVCGEAESAAQALSLTEKLKPDLVLTDISLLVLSMHEESLYAGRALRAGARGYIMKRAGGDRVVAAIREVFQGRIAVSPEMATHLLEEYSGRRSRSGRTSLPSLTDREFEVFQLLGEARSNREIADQLHLSIKTVEAHRMSLARKLKLKTAAELLRFALQYTEKESMGSLEG